MIHILQILPGLGCYDGIANVVLNWHRHIDRSKIQFDYLIHSSHVGTNCFTDEVRKLGGRIFCIPCSGLRDSVSFARGIKRFFQNNHYDIVHSHITHLNAICFSIAKFYGVKTIIQHAHLTAWSDKKWSAIRNYVLLHAVWPLIDYKLACSDLAGKVYFKKNYLVVNNGIDLEKFRFNPKIREQTRAKLNVQDKLVVGHVGRFVPQKNHFFLIDIFEQIHKMRPNSALLLIGTGPALTAVQEYVHKKGLQHAVLFLGTRQDVNELLQAMDIFLLPSLFEGLPVVGVEAQAAGLPCIFSDQITKEVLISPLSKRLSLTDSSRFWAKQSLDLQKYQFRRSEHPVQENAFDIKQVVKNLQKFYVDIMG